MKIVFINNGYPFGSTGRIVKSLDECCRNLGHETVAIYGQGIKTGASHYKIASFLYIKLQALRSRITGIMYGGCILSTRKAIRIIKKEKPDIVHLHCLNSNFINIFKIVSWLKNNHVNTVVTNHAEFLYTATCGHAFDCEKYQTGCGNCPMPKKETKSWFRDGTHRSWVKMERAFRGFQSLIVVNVSPWLNQRSAGSAILGGVKNVTILNGIDTSVFHYRNNYLSGGDKVIFHATANFSDDPNDIKGGRFLIELARKFEGQNVKFIVAGKTKPGLAVPPNMVLLGNVANQDELAGLYSSADLVVITSQKETFSMITAESLCCGTPVVGFKAGGPESITIPEYSEFVEYGDNEALFSTTKKFLNLHFDKETISASAQQKYSKEEMANHYLKVYKECISQHIPK